MLTQRSNAVLMHAQFQTIQTKLRTEGEAFLVNCGQMQHDELIKQNKKIVGPNVSFFQLLILVYLHI